MRLVDGFAGRGQPFEPAVDPETVPRFLPVSVPDFPLPSAVCWSHQAIYDQAQQDSRYSGMGTTVVGAWVENHVASVAHVGDSRAYLWHKRQFEPLTRDHSLVEAQVDAGLLTSDGSLQAEEQNVLLHRRTDSIAFPRISGRARLERNSNLVMPNHFALRDAPPGSRVEK